jgi:hypothetical protein
LHLKSIDYRLIFPLYRSLKYLRKFDPNATAYTPGYDTNGVGGFFTIRTPDEILDSYNQQLSDICYVAGEVIQIKSSTPIEYCLIGVYLNPVVATAETYKSWISDEAYYAVVYKAVSILYGSVLNNPAKMRSNQQLAQEEFVMVRNSNIIAEGY